MKITTKESCYAKSYPRGPQHVFQVSCEALEDKRKNWKEIPGVAYGWAIVSHPDWKEIANQIIDASACIHAELLNGTLAHVGSIHKNSNQIELAG